MEPSIPKRKITLSNLCERRVVTDALHTMTPPPPVLPGAGRCRRSVIVSSHRHRRRVCTCCCAAFQHLSGMDDGQGHIPFYGAPPFHTLVGPGQFARVSRERSGEENQAQPGGELQAAGRCCRRLLLLVV